jgi:O-antigen/teichoic acid export membrane protein
VAAPAGEAVTDGEAPRTGRGAGGLRERSLRSVAWVAALQLLLGALQFGAPLALSYLISPTELGLVELAVAVVGLGVVVVELGTGPAVVQRAELEGRFVATVFWVNVASGLAWATLLAAAAPPLAALMGGDARLVPLLWGVALGLVISSLGIVPQALLVRRMEFRRVTLATGLGVVGAIAAGSYGLLRHGVLGVAWGFLAFASVNSLAVWLGAGFRPAHRPRANEIVPLLRFGGSAFGATAGERLAQQTERFLIAGFLGAESLGIFALARSLIRDPLRRLMSVFDEILFPGLAALQGEPERARRYYLTAVRYELAIFGPAVVFVAVFADELVRLLYGPDWWGAALVAQLLALHTWRTITSHSIGAVFLSHGRPDVRLKWVVISIVLVPVTFLVGRPWGLPGYALACSLFGVVGWAISHTMANRLIGLDWAAFWRAIRRPLLSHASFAALLFALRLALRERLAADPRLAVLALVPALPCYLALLAALDRPLLRGVVVASREAVRLRESERPAPTPAA